MGGNNEFFENFERNKYLKTLPSMQKVKHSPLTHSLQKPLNQMQMTKLMFQKIKRHCFRLKNWLLFILV